MNYRAFVLRFSLLAAMVALTAFAFLSFKPAGTAHATIAHSCSVSPMPPVLNQPGELTCTLDFHGTTHTLVVDFVLTLPPTITGCTLDGNAIHVGPCPD